MLRSAFGICRMNRHPSHLGSMTFGSLPERILGDRRDRRYPPRFAASYQVDRILAQSTSQEGP